MITHGWKTLSRAIKRFRPQIRPTSNLETIGTANGVYDLSLALRVKSLQRPDPLFSKPQRPPTLKDTNSSMRLNRLK